MVPVPPVRYGGTERIVGVLADGLHARGHDVTLYASGDSRVASKLVPVVPRALWRSGYESNPGPFVERAVDMVMNDAAAYDVIHGHLEGRGFELARRSPTPVVTTLHGRLDVGPTASLLETYRDIGLVAISANQRSYKPDANWLATIHNGLPLRDLPFGHGDGGYLLFVGRLAPEKGVPDAIEVARRSGRLLVLAAKAIEPREIALYEAVVAPAAAAGHVRFVGEVGGAARDQLFANAAATLMMGEWPEPFGLVAIESLAAGTPVIARHRGALPEIIEHGTDGFLVVELETAAGFVGRVPDLDRQLIRARALDRFSADRMVDAYAALFERVANGHAGTISPRAASDERVGTLPIRPEQVLETDPV
jgi:glycosyltransferase involved in cell wall biosynthesis